MGVRISLVIIIIISLTNDYSHGYQRRQPCWPTAQSVVKTYCYKMASCSTCNLTIDKISDKLATCTPKVLFKTSV